MPFSDLIFVFGNSRSGTTMMGRILNQSPRVWTCKHEIHFWGQIHSPKEQRLTEDQQLSYIQKLLRTQRDGYFSKKTLSSYEKRAKELIASSPLDISDPALLYYEFLRVEAKANGKDKYCDQTPRNLFYLDELQSYYPDAKFINMVRDPRDVLLSQKYKWKRRFLGGKDSIPLSESIRSWANYHPITISKIWKASIETSLKPNDIKVLHVKYESLIEKPDLVLQEVCDYLKIKYEPKMKEVPVVGSSAQRDLNLAKGLRKDNLNKWKKGGLSNTEIYLCELICKYQLGKFDYRKSDVRPNPIALFVYMILLPFQIGFSLVLNLTKNKNILDTIKRKLNK
ncbi:sulfotransferase [Ekhidna sp.]|uniref:sulfotransferase family protein n=1 Tax=Ekhidna sp. TaxID=2608089 RepID=UPI0032EB90CA